MSEAAWFVVSVPAGREAASLRRILSGRAGARVVSALLPTVEIKTAKGERPRKPLVRFPGYLFLEVSGGVEGRADISAVPGVLGFLGSPEPQALSAAEVERYREAAAPVLPKYKPGDTVEVIAEPFAGSRAVVESLDAERGRLSILVTLFGRQTRLDLPFDAVRE